MTLFPNGEELRYRAPKGAMTDKFRAVIRGETAMPQQDDAIPLSDRSSYWATLIC